MKQAYLQYLICPFTQATLDLDIVESEGDNIITGTLTSTADASYRYPISGGVPRFVQVEAFAEGQQETVETFSQKWQIIPDFSHDEASRAYREGWYFERFNFPKGDEDVRRFLAGAEFLLEAGTGTGVDTSLLTRNSDGLVFGIDISTAIDAAYQKFKDNPRVVLIQADIAHLPFRQDFFDVISCDQVLHHTPTPEENFVKLTKLLKANGKFLLYVYKIKGVLREFSDDYLRGLYVESSLEAALDFSERITRLGRNLSRLENAYVEVEDEIHEFGIPKGRYHVQRLIFDYMFKCYWNESYDEQTNIMANFDWYRPKHAYRYRPEDIQRWCQDYGMALAHMHVSPSGISTIMNKSVG